MALQWRRLKRVAIEDMHGRWLLLAADCSIEPGTPEELLLAARAAATTA